jgi:hypothetical protein
MGACAFALFTLWLLKTCERPRVPPAAPLNSRLPSKMPLKHMGGKQNLDDIPKEMGTISASKGRAGKKAASNHDLRRKQ